MHKYVTGDIIRDKVRGTFIAGAVGEALAGPYNHRNPEEILLENPLGIKSFRDYPRIIRGKKNEYWKPAGSFKSGTQQTLLAAEHVIENKGLYPQIFSLSLAELVNSGNYRGGAKNTRAWAEKIKSGESYKTASSADAETAGSISRNSAVALFYWPDKNILREKTIECSSVSHRRWDVVGPCLTFSRLIQLSMSGYPTEKYLQGKNNHFVDEEVELYEQEVVMPLLKIAHNVEKLPGATDIQKEKTAHFKTRVVATQARNAFAQFPFDFTEAINSAALRSWDRDTCAKLTGELIGSRHGIGIVPEELIETLEDNKRILSIADKLYETHLEVFPPETRTLNIQVPQLERSMLSNLSNKRE